MTQFVLLNVVMVSLGVMLFLAARSLARVTDEKPDKMNVLERWVTSEIPYRVDKIILAWQEKLYRKLKVIMLRFDNSLTEKLRKMNEGSKLFAGKQPKGDIKEIVGEGNGGVQSEE